MKLIIFILLFSFQSFGQGRLVVNGWQQGPGCAYLLDSYPGSEIALSLRKIDCNYSGSAIRVRRSSDDAEQDIGFSGTSLDVSGMLTFVGAGDGFVTIWYDQSGNGNDATQSTGTKQPQIVDDGAVIEQNSLPTVKFDGSNDFLEVASLTRNTYTSLYIVLRAVNNSAPLFTEHSTDAAVQFGFYFYGTNNASWLFNDNAVGPNFAAGVSNWLSSATGSGLALADVQYNGTGAYYANNSSQSNGSVTGSSTSNISGSKTLYIFSRAGTALFTDGHLSEYILYDSDQTSNRADIVSNINTYYSIY